MDANDPLGNPPDLGTFGKLPKPLEETATPRFLRSLAAMLLRMSDDPQMKEISDELVRIADAYVYCDAALQRYALRRDGAYAIIALVRMNWVIQKRTESYKIEGYGPMGFIHQPEVLHGMVNARDVEIQELKRRIGELEKAKA